MTKNISAQDKVFELLFEEDEITWQSILFKLVTKEQMNPWDINISLISKRFMDMMKKLKEMDFNVSGKIILAAALLLRLKSFKLVDEDILELDRLIASTDENEDIYSDLIDFEEPLSGTSEDEKPGLIPRTPQPRKRKVSIYDLVDALEKALEVRKRRVIRNIPQQNIQIPEKTVDISLVIGEIFRKIKNLFLKGNKRLTFNNLIPSDSKDDKIYTFIPLLHLTNQRKINLHQQNHFEDFEVELLNKQEKV
jgi:segregation and condensation protein A